jgi:hypothetical protein
MVCFVFIETFSVSNVFPASQKRHIPWLCPSTVIQHLETNQHTRGSHEMRVFLPQTYIELAKLTTQPRHLDGARVVWVEVVLLVIVSVATAETTLCTGNRRCEKRTRILLVGDSCVGYGQIIIRYHALEVLVYLAVLFIPLYPQHKYVTNWKPIYR